MGPDRRAARLDGLFDEAIRLHQQVRRETLGSAVTAAEALLAAFGRGNRVLVFGNGGSAADAQHFAAELVVRFERDRQALPVIALSTDTSVLTAAANDYGFDRVFARQLAALGAPGDVVVGISTSGVSANVVTAFELARDRGMITIALTGRDGGVLGRLADIHVNVAHPSTARVQEVQRTLLHGICALVEDALVGGGAADGKWKMENGELKKET
jgi:D-sedoheptulose 7-phosphate isomerase